MKGDAPPRQGRGNAQHSAHGNRRTRERAAGTGSTGTAGAAGTTRRPPPFLSGKKESGNDAPQERRTLRQHSGRGRGSPPVIVAFPRPFARASAPSRNRLPFPAAKPPRAGVPSPRKESFNPLIFAFGGAHRRGFLRETRGNFAGTLTPPPDAERNLFPTPPLEGLRGAGERVFRAARRRLGFSRPTLPPSIRNLFPRLAPPAPACNAGEKSEFRKSPPLHSRFSFFS